MELVRSSRLTSAMISVVHKGGIKFHRGDTTLVLRYLLPLRIPPVNSDAANSKLELSVANKRKATSRDFEFINVSFREGSDIIFDDTFGHFVRHERDGAR